MTNSKTKICQNCKAKFVIEPEDFDFYKKISVPTPTFCPECRLQRRMTFQNWDKLYKRKCDFSGKEIVSIYREDSPYKIYEQKIWWSDKWDALKYGKNYDFNQPFLRQFKNLTRRVPRHHSFNVESINCDYCAATSFSKNCYLSLCNSCEDCAYILGYKDNNCFDSTWIMISENCYENIDCNHNYNVFFSQYADNCIDSTFLFNCRNCQNCFACVNLRNKKYHIFNKLYSKTNYQKKIKKYNLSSFENVQRVKNKFSQFKFQLPHKFAIINKTYNVVGNNLSNVKNCYYCFDATLGVENCKYIVCAGLNLKDSYDICDAGTNSQLIYEGVSVGNKGSCAHVAFSEMILRSSHHIQYSSHCYSSSNLFACVGLRHKKYCILNKQYTKEEYNKLVPKIKQHMNDMPYIDKKGRIYKYGEFFPIELSPFSYNETIANEYFPLTKEQALKQGYSWYDKPKAEYKPTIKAKDLPDNIKDVNKDILKEVIKCSSPNCAGSGVFRIIPQELKFYKKMNLPLPRLCPDCRHRERIKQRNPLKLWKRKCMKKGCSNKFQTTYAPDRKEIVYCESCYNKEVG